MTSPEKPRILCVDDEPNLLRALRRNLRQRFDVTTAESGEAGLRCVAEQEPFVVVVSDMKMPLMDGATFLRKVREAAPDSVRMLLTGQTEMDAAIAAVNDGQIFRFLTKPCPAEQLTQSLLAGVEQHRLITAEHELLEGTLRGSIRMLSDILAQVNPEAFGTAARVQKTVSELLEALGIEEKWPIEVAAMLAPIGSVTLPPETALKLRHGEPLTDDEQLMMHRLPEMTDQLFANIPRLEPVRAILHFQEKHFDGSGLPHEPAQGDDIPLGARVLKVARDFDLLADNGLAPGAAIEKLRERDGWYDPVVLQALAREAGAAGDGEAEDLRLVSAADLRAGMILADDVKSTDGRMLMARGQEVSTSLILRILNFASGVGVREPMRVIVPPGLEPDGENEDPGPPTA